MLDYWASFARDGPPGVGQRRGLARLRIGAGVYALRRRRRVAETKLMPGMYALNEAVMCRKAAGGIGWNWNVGLGVAEAAAREVRRVSVTAASAADLRGGDRAGGVIGAQPHLVDLARRRERHRRARARPDRESTNRRPCRAADRSARADRPRSLSRLDDQHRALAPFVVVPADHRDVPDVGMAPDDRLDLVGIDPLAARLDQILGAAADRQIAVGVDRREVAGVEIALVVERVARPP